MKNRAELATSGFFAGVVFPRVDSLRGSRVSSPEAGLQRVTLVIDAARWLSLGIDIGVFERDAFTKSSNISVVLNELERELSRAGAQDAFVRNRCETLAFLARFSAAGPQGLGMDANEELQLWFQSALLTGTTAAASHGPIASEIGSALWFATPSKWMSLVEGDLRDPLMTAYVSEFIELVQYMDSTLKLLSEISAACATRNPAVNNQIADLMTWLVPLGNDEIGDRFRQFSQLACYRVSSELANSAVVHTLSEELDRLYFAWREAASDPMAAAPA